MIEKPRRRKPKGVPSEDSKKTLQSRIAARAKLSCKDKLPILLITSCSDSVKAEMGGQTLTRRDGESYLEFQRRVFDAAPANRVAPVMGQMIPHGRPQTYVATHSDGTDAVESIPGESEAEFVERMNALWRDKFVLHFWKSEPSEISPEFAWARELGEKTRKRLKERGSQGLLAGEELKLAWNAIPDRFTPPPF